MPQFDDQSAKRISRATRGWERRQRGRPPKRPRWHGRGPDDKMVKTPAGGITARDGTTVYSALCTVCVLEISAEGQRTIHETDYEEVIFNVYPSAVAGSVYVMTSVMTDGTRYVSGEPC